MERTYATKPSDDYATPVEVWQLISKYIPTSKQIWCPFYFNGHHNLRQLNDKINIIHKNEDFFKNNHGDIIIDNPPFSIMAKIFVRLKQLNKPFILLCRINTLANKYLEHFKRTGKIQVIIPNGRIKYNGKSPNFDSCFLCYNMDLEQDLIFL